jgi:hypothetical protein
MPAALILGSAASLWSDLQVLGPWPGLVIAVNRAGTFHPDRLDHWVSLHPEQLGGFMAEREAMLAGHDALRAAWGPFTTWCQRPHDGTRVDRVEAAIPGTGSSGLFAVRIALARLGCERVVLAGVPIDNSPHFYDGGLRSGPGFVPYRPEWRAAAEEEFGGRVRSLSGWTAELLGRPDPAWLAGEA